MMKSKHLLQVLVALAMLVGLLGGISQAYAQTEALATVVLVGDLTIIRDATYAGYVSSGRYEKWAVTLEAETKFSVAANPFGEDLTTLVILQDGQGTALTQSSHSLTTTQPAGNYFVLIQPETGAGFYTFVLQVLPTEEPPTTDPEGTISVYPPTIFKGETAKVTLGLGNIPAEGYTSAEYVCTYDPDLLVIENVVPTDAFGPDPAIAQKGPENGQFIFAIAASDGYKAFPPAVGGDNTLQARSPTTNKEVFSIDARSPTTSSSPEGPAAGGDMLAVATEVNSISTNISCTVRVSSGDGKLVELKPITGALTITDEPPPPPKGWLEGQVLAGKPVTVKLYDEQNAEVASVSANADGTFKVEVIAGTYKVVATADGFLRAEGVATIVANETTTKGSVTLWAGDINGDDRIDNVDAMTIGMNYNLAEPTAADLNNDLTINVLDLDLLADNFRATGPTDWP